MSFRIKTISPADAKGPIKRIYDAAIGRAGKVFNIIRCMSLNPEQVRASMMLYQSCMFQPSNLSRAERELIAVVVSRANDCHY
ncbi:MAG: putative peroxidase-related enzyme [Planctomycetota bacterium]|jgi:uncharacterized peroxidase-related enzyme